MNAFSSTQVDLDLQKANELYQQGKLLQAEAAYCGILERSPDNLYAIHPLGLIALETNRPDLAAKLFRKAIAVDGNVRAFPNNLGHALQDLNQLEDAIESYENAIRIDPNYANAHYNRGIALQAMGRLDDALGSYDKVLELNPRDAEAYNNRGRVLEELDRLSEALTAYDAALLLRDNFAEIHSNRGNVLKKLGNLDAALDSYDRAIRLKPNYPEAHSNRGNALHELGRFEEALDSYNRAIQLKPDYVTAYANRGRTLFEMKRIEEALQSYDRATVLKPDFADAHSGKGYLLLLLGDFIKGWQAYEWRKKDAALKGGLRSFSQPEWSGADDIAGKTLFIQCEQGLGDTIQFCRYARLAEARGANVVLSTQDSLMGLLKGLSPTIEIIDSKSTPPKFDYHVALLSMPLALKTDESRVPADIPYLRADPDRIERWRLKLCGQGFKIGVAWQGSKLGTSFGKSFHVACLHSISQLPGVRLISLQKNEGSEQVMTLPDGMKVETLGDDFDCGPDAFLDTAAVMENLDLVITADTSIAHLAGALGRPTWIALKLVPDWRWLLDRNDSPWYPTMRLFRQPARDDWSSVFAAMEKELTRIVDRNA